MTINIDTLLHIDELVEQSEEIMMAKEMHSEEII